MDYSEPFRQRFHPDHLKDLERSGLSEETIRDLEIYSARPHDIPQLIGRNPPEVRSALVFPYPGEGGFCRVKVFPPFVDKNGHTVRYLQRPGSGVHLYVPPLAACALKDPYRPLGWTEGEKKAAKASQEGIPSVGIGGLWNWLEDGNPITKLDEIAHAEREEVIYPDSDVWVRRDLIRPVYALGKELEARGAVVKVAIIRPGKNGQKRGFDDFLVDEGLDALTDLKKIGLKDKTFHDAATWWKKWGKEREAKVGAQAALPRELRGRLVHPALHFEEEWAAVGLIKLSEGGERECLLVTSERKHHRAKEMAPALRVAPFPYRDLVGRWPEDALHAFLQGESEPSLAQVLALLVAKVRELLDLRRPEEAPLLAVWSMATYFFPLFRAFPRLEFRGERGSGKSKALQLLAQTCFNGLHRVDPTPAVLFRLTETLRPTLCLDEIEKLSTEDRREILAIINSGYQRGGAVDRVEGQEERRVVSFEVYAPMALAGIRGLNATTEERAISLVMQRGTDPSRLNADVNPADPEWARIRAGCYCLALTRFQVVRGAYEGLGCPEWLVGRERELWRPLLAIAELADQEEGLEIREDLLKLAKAQGDERGGLSMEAEIVLELLEEELGAAASVPIRPGNLCHAMEERLRRRITPESVGTLLRRLGFRRLGHRRRGAEYEITREQIEAMRAVYTPILTVTPSPSHDNFSQIKQL